jgi:hypothetical protein
MKQVSACVQKIPQCRHVILFLFQHNAASETQRAAEGKEREVQAVSTVPEGKNPDDGICAVCYERSEFLFNDEREEWLLRGAVHRDGMTFHPTCCEDYKVSIFLMKLHLL